MTGTTMKTATCVEPKVYHLGRLNSMRWYLASGEMTLTRKAAQGVVAVTAFYSWTADDATIGRSPVEFMLALYGNTMCPGEKFALVLQDLLADLWHLAAAYGVPLDALFLPIDPQAMSLRVVLLEIREAARGPWAVKLDDTGMTLEEIESEAYQSFLCDCTDPLAQV